MIDDIKAIPLAEIKEAHQRLQGLAIRSPMVRSNEGPANKEIHLKLENLQLMGSFKIRPIGNAVMTRSKAALAQGIYTASSGNSALGVAWMAKHLGIPATAVVPDNAPEAKLEGLRLLGAKILKLSYDEWWRVIETAGYPAAGGLYIDAVRDPAALAGDGTIGLEILDQLPDVEAILIPLGGGGLACGIACAIRALKPDVKIIACELTTAQPATAAFAAGKPVAVQARPGFVSGIGVGFLLPEMWPLIRDMIDGTITVSLAEVAAAIKIMATGNKVIAEGAGAVSVAAALSGRYDYAKVCAVVSGGNISSEMLAAILRGEIPA